MSGPGWPKLWDAPTRAEAMERLMQIKGHRGRPAEWSTPEMLNRAAIIFDAQASLATGDARRAHLETAAALRERAFCLTEGVTMENEHIMQFFAFEHLPAHLKAVSEPFAKMASEIMNLPRNPERTVALRKLLESKDAAVRAKLAGEG